MSDGTLVTAVSLNGTDNVGKTTQLRWLRTGLPSSTPVGTIDRWHPRWAKVAAGDFSRWWFEDSTTEEHVGLVFSSHVARRNASSGLVLEDRGFPMLLALCAATAAVKEGIPPADALNVVERLAAAHQVPECRELRILLRHADDPLREAELALQREERPPSSLYEAYQQSLAAVIELQVRRGDYDVVIVRGDEPILPIQRRIRDWLAVRGLRVEPLGEAAIERLWVIAGMSESGKSTVGELLRTEHGSTRMKIGYLLGVVAARAGVADPYVTWTQEEQAEALTEEVLRFAAANKVTRLSVESAHQFQSTLHLKRIWGERCEVVWLDAEPATRARRSTEDAESIGARDVIKAERGADRIARIADWAIDNSRSMAALKAAVSRVAATTATFTVPVHPDSMSRTMPPGIARWLTDAVAQMIDSGTALVAATGSTASADWRAGWSDLDLLLVRDELPVAWLRRTLRLTPPGGVKIGVSAFSTHELSALRVPPRIHHVLGALAAGMRGVLYVRPGLLLPAPDTVEVDRTSRVDLPLVVMRLRRLVAEMPPDLRALYKHVVLAMKIVLRADGVEVNPSDEVISSFRTTYGLTCDLPPLDEITAADWRSDGDMATRVLQAAEVVLYHHDALAQGVRRRSPRGRSDHERKEPR